MAAAVVVGRDCYGDVAMGGSCIYHRAYTSERESDNMLIYFPQFKSGELFQHEVVNWRKSYMCTALLAS